MLSFFGILFLFLIGGLLCLALVVAVMVQPITGFAVLALAILSVSLWKNGLLPHPRKMALWFARGRVALFFLAVYALFPQADFPSRTAFIASTGYGLHRFWLGAQKARPEKKKGLYPAFLNGIFWLVFLLLTPQAVIGYGFFLHATLAALGVFALWGAAAWALDRSWRPNFTGAFWFAAAVLGVALFYRYRLVNALDCRAAWNRPGWVWAHREIGTFFDVEFDPLDNRLYAASSEDAKILSFDFDSEPPRVGSVAVEGGTPQRIGLDPGRKKIILPLMRGIPTIEAAEGSGRIVTFDWSDPKNFQTRNLDACMTMVDVEVRPETDRFYSLCDVKKQLDVHSIGDLKLLRRIPNGGSYQVIQPQGTDRLYVSDEGGEIQYFDAGTLAVRKARRIGIAALGIAYSVKRNSLYAARPLYRRVDELDGDTLAWKNSVRTSFFPRDLTIDDGNDRLFVGAYGAGKVDILDLNSRKAAASVPLGKLVRGLRWNAEAQRLFACSGCGVFEIDPDREAGKRMRNGKR